MKKRLLILFLFSSLFVFSQKEKSKEQVKMEELQAQKETITKLEKERLKEKIVSINERLKSNVITEEEAEKLKKAAAEQHALNIENQYDLIDLNIDLIKRNQKDTLANDYYIKAGAILTDTKRMSAVDSIPSVFLAASYVGFGINSVLDQTQDTYKDIGFSMQVGVRFTTVFSRKSPEYRLNYGVGLDLNILSIKDNKIFSDAANQAQLVSTPLAIEKSNLVLSNLIFPVHFEYGKIDTDYEGKRAKYDLYSGWNYGIGGFLGTKLSSGHGFKYSDDGEDVSVSIQRKYNTENFLYGLSAYAGYGMFKLNVKYHLNSIFKSSNANGNILMVGVLLGY